VNERSFERWLLKTFIRCLLGWVLTGSFVKRNSWPHSRVAAQVISVGGLTGGPLPGPAPHHQPPGAKKLVAMAKVSYRGEPAQVQELTGPGTFAYNQIE
jgi:hypothetical protein